MDTSREFILRAEEQLALGSSLQASEKGWGAAAHAVKAVAEHRGWRHNSHRDLYRAVHRITSETARGEINSLFGSANALHQNFYEGWMEDENIALSLSDIKRLLNILEPLAAD